MASLDKAKKAIEVSGAMKLDETLEHQYAMLEQNLLATMPPGVTPAEVSEMVSIMKTTVMGFKPQIESVIVSAYVAAFEDAEIDKLIEFHESKEGISLQKKMPKVQHEIYNQTVSFLSQVVSPILNPLLEAKMVEIENRLLAEEEALGGPDPVDKILDIIRGYLPPTKKL